LYGFSSIRPIPRDVPRAANLTPRARGIKAMACDFARVTFSTVLLKSLWKRRIEEAHTAINIALDAVCTQMKHFFHAFAQYKMLRHLFSDENRSAGKIDLQGNSGRKRKTEEFSFNTISEDAPA
jgi:hypothetical protein